MPLVQGSNVPLTIKFDSSVENLPKLVVTLWSDMRPGQPLKMWELSDMTVSGDTVICPLTEDETATMPKSVLTVLAKGLDSNGQTVFWDEYPLNTLARKDRIIKLTRQEGG